MRKHGANFLNWYDKDLILESVGLDLKSVTQEMIDSANLKINKEIRESRDRLKSGMRESNSLSLLKCVLVGDPEFDDSLVPQSPSYISSFSKELIPEIVKEVEEELDIKSEPKKAKAKGCGRDKFNAQIGSIPNQINNVLIDAQAKGELISLEDITIKTKLPKERVKQHLEWHSTERSTFECLEGKWRIKPLS